MKRSRIKRKVSAAEQANRQARQEFVASQGKCHVCGCRRPTECHEIASGIHRKAALAHRHCWLAVCGTCHRWLHDHAVYPLERQLAFKWINDPDYFDRVAFNRLRVRADNAITIDEVQFWIRKEMG